MDTNKERMEHYIREILSHIGDDEKREGLVETPERVVRSWDTLFAGYKMDVRDIIKTFEEDEPRQNIIMLRDVELYSTCEHHFLPFHGKATIAYVPQKKLIGVSKLARLLEMYSRRLQIQERIGEQVATTLMEEVGAKGAACIIEAQHFCMTSRGVEKQNAIMVTSALKGVFDMDINARNELLQLMKG